MNLSKLCINRPVLAIVLNLILVTIGFMSFKGLDTRYLPQADRPIIAVTTDFPGANSKVVETDVTIPLEKAISKVSDIKRMVSSSSKGQSQITVVINHGVDVNVKANQIRNKIAKVRGILPDGVKSPVVGPKAFDGNTMYIGVIDSKRSPQELRDYLERNIADQFRQVPGVASVNVEGASEYAVRVWLDPEKMAALKVTPGDVSQTLAANNVRGPGIGVLYTASKAYPLVVDSDIERLDQFGDLLVTQVDGKQVRLRDIAKIELGRRWVKESEFRIDGHKASVLAITYETDVNPLSVAEDIQRKLDLVNKTSPESMTFDTIYDFTPLLHDSVNEVYETIAIAVICVLGVIALFLGTWRNVVIPLVTIPVCLIFGFALIKMFGFSINVMTLLALVFSVGLVVDDAIVMLENIHRYIEKGVKPIKAAVEGSKEITFAIIAMTVTLAAVYAPLGLMQGKIAIFMSSFAYTLAGTVVISGFVALTLTPMMCAYLLPEHSKESRYILWLDKFTDKMQVAYKSFILAALRFRWIVVILVGLFAWGGYWLFHNMPAAFMPDEDMGYVMMNLQLPDQTNYEYAKTHVVPFQKLMVNLPEKNMVWENVNSGSAQLFVKLQPLDKRTRSASEIADSIRQKMPNLPGIRGNVMALSFGRRAGDQAFQLQLLSSGSYKELFKMANRVKADLKSYPGLSNINVDKGFDTQEYHFKINRDMASRLGLSIAAINEALSVMLGGAAVNQFDWGNHSYDVVVQVEKSQLNNLNNIGNISIRNASGDMISLANLVKVEPKLGQKVRQHYNGFRSTTLSANIAKDYSIGQVVKDMQRIMPKILPQNAQFEFAGEAKDYLKSRHDQGFVFLMAIVFIYLVLAALFESFIDPFVVLLSVPLCIVSALASLKLFGGSINLYTMIGLVTLIGLIAKHGILITQFANEIRARGESVYEAVATAAAQRLRPILMTTAAMVMGAVPLVFSSGASANSRFEIGLVIVSGLIFGTLFSLVVVPVAYTFLARLKR